MNKFSNMHKLSVMALLTLAANSAWSQVPRCADINGGTASGAATGAVIGGIAAGAIANNSGNGKVSNGEVLTGAIIGGLLGGAARREKRKESDPCVDYVIQNAMIEALNGQVGQYVQYDSASVGSRTGIRGFIVKTQDGYNSRTNQRCMLFNSQNIKGSERPDDKSGAACIDIRGNISRVNVNEVIPQQAYNPAPPVYSPAPPVYNPAPVQQFRILSDLDFSYFRSSFANTINDDDRLRMVSNLSADLRARQTRMSASQLSMILSRMNGTTQNQTGLVTANRTQVLRIVQGAAIVQSFEMGMIDAHFPNKRHARYAEAHSLMVSLQF